MKCPIKSKWDEKASNDNEDVENKKHLSTESSIKFIANHTCQIKRSTDKKKPCQIIDLLDTINETMIYKDCSVSFQNFILKTLRRRMVTVVRMI
jgi:hypothetical protein